MSANILSIIAAIWDIAGAKEVYLVYLDIEVHYVRESN
jgi:hypothetical protein